MLDISAAILISASATASTPGGFVVPVPVRAQTPPAVGRFAPAQRVAGSACDVPWTVYSNTFAFAGSAVPQGGETLYTLVEPLNGGGGPLDSIAFSVAYLGSTGTYTGGEVRVDLTARLPSGLPDPTPAVTLTLALDEIFQGAFTLEPGQFRVAVFTGIQADPNELPRGPFFVGLTFLEAGGADSINNLGQAIYGPADIGRSGDQLVLGSSPITLDGLPQSTALAFGVIAPPILDGYTFQRVVLPADSTSFAVNPDINDLGQFAAYYAVEDSGFFVAGAPERPRTVQLEQPSSPSGVGVVSISENNTASFNVPFAGSGFDRGVYAVDLDAGDPFLLTSTTPSGFAPFLHGTAAGGLAGGIDFAGEGGSHAIVRYPAGPAPIAPVILGQDRGGDPTSDVIDYDFFSFNASKAGSVVALGELVTGGNVLRLFPADGAAPIDLARDSLADPTSPIAEIERLSQAGVNNNNEVVVIATNNADEDEIYAHRDGQTFRLFSAQQLARRGITFLPFQELSLNDHGTFVFRANPVFFGVQTGVWIADLDGNINELIRTNCPYHADDGGVVTFSNVFSNDPAINNRGQIVILGDARTLGSEFETVLVATPPTLQPACPGDTNADDRVDVNDLLTVIANLGLGTPNGAVDGDVDGSGAVDVGDLLAVVADLGKACD